MNKTHLVLGSYPRKAGVRRVVYSTDLDLRAEAYVPAAEVARRAGLDPETCVLVEVGEPLPKLPARLPTVTLANIGRSVWK